MSFLSNRVSARGGVLWLFNTFLFLSTSLCGATYHVEKSGNDSNPCTVAAPCLTIARGAQISSLPGDVLQVGAGDYAEQVTLTRSGAVGSPITLRGHAGGGCRTESGDPTFSVDGVRAAPSVTFRGFIINANYITIDCFHSTDTSNTGFYVGKEKHHITISHNRVSRGSAGSTPAAGVSLGYSYSATEGLPSMPHDIHVYMNVISGATKGLHVFCRLNCLFESNEVYDSYSNGDETDYVRVFGEYIVFRGNRFHGNSTLNCAGCHIDCFQTFNLDRGYLYELARHITIDGNFCTSAHQGIITSSSPATPNGSIDDWLIMNNIFTRGPDGGRMSWCALFQSSTNMRMYNNLCANGGAIGYRRAATGEFKNNMVYGNNYNPLLVETGGSYIEANNWFYDPAFTYSTTKYPNSTVNTNPLLRDAQKLDFRLTAASPALDGGVPLAPVVRDYTGAPRPQGAGYDVGPFEFQESASIVEPPSNLRLVVR